MYITFYVKMAHIGETLLPIFSVSIQKQISKYGSIKTYEFPKISKTVCSSVILQAQASNSNTLLGK
jgi:hypothetical protein